MWGDESLACDKSAFVLCFMLARCFFALALVRERGDAAEGERAEDVNIRPTLSDKVEGIPVALIMPE